MSFKRKASLFVGGLLIVYGKDAAGNKSNLFDGTLVAESNNHSVLTVEETADPFTFKLTRTGIGSALVTVSGDVDPGDGIKTISQVFDFEFWDGDNEVVGLAGDLVDDFVETKPETAQAETAQAETAQAETAQAETAQAETAQAETAQAETAQPETAQPETAQAETAQAETAQAETAQAETAQAETAQPETAQAEAAKAA